MPTVAQVWWALWCIARSPRGPFKKPLVALSQLVYFEGYANPTLVGLFTSVTFTSCDLDLGRWHEPLP